MKLKLLLVIFVVGTLLLLVGCSEQEEVANADVELKAGKEEKDKKKAKETKESKDNVLTKVKVADKFIHNFFSLERSELAKMIRTDSINDENEFIEFANTYGLKAFSGEGVNCNFEESGNLVQLICTNEENLTFFADLSIFEDSDGFYIKDAELFPPQRITYNKLKDIDSHKWIKRYEEENGLLEYEESIKNHLSRGAVDFINHYFDSVLVKDIPSIADTFNFEVHSGYESQYFNEEEWNGVYNGISSLFDDNRDFDELTGLRLVSLTFGSISDIFSAHRRNYDVEFYDDYDEFMDDMDYIKSIYLLNTSKPWKLFKSLIIVEAEIEYQTDNDSYIEFVTLPLYIEDDEWTTISPIWIFGGDEDPSFR